MAKYIFILLFHTIYSQEKFEVKNIGFSIDVPENWIILENKDVLENLNNYDLNDETKRDFFLSSNKATELVTYSKYNPEQYKGIIPTIKIRIKELKSDYYVDFLKFVEESNLKVKEQLHNFSYIEKPKIITISNREVVQFSTLFSMFQNKKEFTIIAYSYYILKEGYYISINFIEEYKKEDNYHLFQNLIHSVELK